MKKRLTKILRIILICVVILCALEIFVTIGQKMKEMNKMEGDIVDTATDLMNAISAKDYDDIRNCVKNIDGTELSNEQITNFLFNTGLYRATLPVNEATFNYSVDVKFFDTDKRKYSI